MALPLYHIAARLPAEPGWTVLAFAHDADGKRIEIDPGRYSVMAHPVAAWGVLRSISPYSAFASFLGGGGEPAPCPLGEAGDRLDELPGFICLSPPGEAPQEAIERIEEPQRRAAERVAAR